MVVWSVRVESSKDGGGYAGAAGGGGSTCIIAWSFSSGSFLTSCSCFSSPPLATVIVIFFVLSRIEYRI